MKKYPDREKEQLDAWEKASKKYSKIQQVITNSEALAKCSKNNKVINDIKSERAAADAYDQWPKAGRLAVGGQFHRKRSAKKRKGHTRRIKKDKMAKKRERKRRSKVGPAGHF